MNDESHPPHSLLKFQIGPVQDFIAAARSTRDLWSGSYLMSWLMAAGIRELLVQGGEMIFPDPQGQPLLDLPKLPPNGEHKALLTPNLPNIFIARVSGDTKKTAGAVKGKIKEEWLAIAKAVRNKGHLFGLDCTCKNRFDAQVERHISISWQVTPFSGASSETYAEAYRQNGWHLDAVRQTRAFEAWESASGMGEKDSLTGKEEALFGGQAFQEARAKAGGEYHSLFAKHADYLGAISVIKRCWHLAYLRDETERKPRIEAGSRRFTIRSIPAIAARMDEHDDDRAAGETGGGEKYVAAIAFDGDSIGRWVNGDDLPNLELLREHHKTFSGALSDFALNRVRPIIEMQIDGRNKEGQKINVPLGQLIYAGGDDVVALIPADVALAVANDLRMAFVSATSGIKNRKGESPDASAGIAIGHIHAPLQDLIREAQKAEKRAKNTVGRPAFSVTLMKRSGEISYWGSKWGTGGLALYQAIAHLLARGRLSAKFPHRVCQLLEPYLVATTPLMVKADTMQDAEKFDVQEVIAREFAFAVSRQRTLIFEPSDERDLLEKLSAYIRDLGVDPQTVLTSIIGLCTTVGFADRNRDAKDGPNAKNAENQLTHA